MLLMNGKGQVDIGLTTPPETRPAPSSEIAREKALALGPASAHPTCLGHQ